MEFTQHRELSVEEEEDGLGGTYSLSGEGHTLGNALRYLAVKDPQVEFCGYSVPHPAEPVMNIRIQTKSEPSIEALERSLHSLMGFTDNVLQTLDKL